mgnify:FL=1
MMEMIVVAAIDEVLDDPDYEDYKAAKQIINSLSGRQQ